MLIAYMPLSCGIYPSSSRRGVPLCPRGAECGGAGAQGQGLAAAWRRDGCGSGRGCGTKKWMKSLGLGAGKHGGHHTAEPGPNKSQFSSKAAGPH